MPYVREDGSVAHQAAVNREGNKWRNNPGRVPRNSTFLEQSYIIFLNIRF